MRTPWLPPDPGGAGSEPRGTTHLGCCTGLIEGVGRGEEKAIERVSLSQKSPTRSNAPNAVGRLRREGPGLRHQHGRSDSAGPVAPPIARWDPPGPRPGWIAKRTRHPHGDEGDREPVHVAGAT